MNLEIKNQNEFAIGPSRILPNFRGSEGWGAVLNHGNAINSPTPIGLLSENPIKKNINAATGTLVRGKIPYAKTSFAIEGCPLKSALQMGRKCKFPKLSKPLEKRNLHSKSGKILYLEICSHLEF